MRDNELDRDVTGYYVNSSRPVGVIAGQSCANVPDLSVNFCDYMVEQIPPVSELGKEHVTPVIDGRNINAGSVKMHSRWLVAPIVSNVLAGPVELSAVAIHLKATVVQGVNSQKILRQFMS